MSRGYNRTSRGGYSKETIGQKFSNLAMSKPVGKILDSKIGKGMVGVGNAVIATPGKIKSGINKVGNTVANDLFGSPEKNKKQREDAKKLNAEYSGRRSSFRYGIQKRKIA